MIIRRIFSRSDEIFYDEQILMGENITKLADFRWLTLTLFNIFCIFSLIRKTYFCYKELKNTLNNIKILNYGKVCNIWKRMSAWCLDYRLVLARSFNPSCDCTYARGILLAFVCVILYGIVTGNGNGWWLHKQNQIE